MARYGSERIRGHGIPEAMEAILIGKSRMQPKVAVLKPLCVGHLDRVGRSVRRRGADHHDRRVARVARRPGVPPDGGRAEDAARGRAAGGMSATFATPMAAVLLAVELLLFEWKPRSLIPVAVASFVAALLRPMLHGGRTDVPGRRAHAALPTSALLAGGPGRAAGGAARDGAHAAVYAAEDAFHRLPIHWMWWPALGGLVVGLGGLIQPRALGVGLRHHRASSSSEDSRPPRLLLLLVVKGTVWSIALGSGTSGGVLAPLLMVGASVGAVIGSVLPWGSVSLWALVAMGGILGGTMRAPFTGVVFSLELTHDLNVILPLLIAALAAEGLTVFTLPRSILTEKVARHGVHVAREYAVDPLEVIPVSAVMHTDIVMVPADASVQDVVLQRADLSSKYVGYTLVDDAGAAVGFVTKEEIVAFLAAGEDASGTGRPGGPRATGPAVPRTIPAGWGLVI